MSRALCILLVLAASAASAEELPLRDPFRPFTAAVPSDPAGEITATRRLDLQAVVVSPERRIAVINDELHREGERVADAVIVKIERGAVHLRRGGEDFVLRLDGRTSSPVNRGDSTP